MQSEPAKEQKSDQDRINELMQQLKVVQARELVISRELRSLIYKPERK